MLTDEQTEKMTKWTMMTMYECVNYLVESPEIIKKLHDTCPIHDIPENVYEIFDRTYKPFRKIMNEHGALKFITEIPMIYATFLQECGFNFIGNAIFLIRMSIQFSLVKYLHEQNIEKGLVERN